MLVCCCWPQRGGEILEFLRAGGGLAPKYPVVAGLRPQFQPHSLFVLAMAFCPAIKPAS